MLRGELKAPSMASPALYREGLQCRGLPETRRCSLEATLWQDPRRRNGRLALQAPSHQILPQTDGTVFALAGHHWACEGPGTGRSSTVIFAVDHRGFARWRFLRIS